MAIEYRIIGNRSLAALNTEVNKLAAEGFKPTMMSATSPAPVEDDVKGMISAKMGQPSLHVVVMLEKQG